MRKNVSRRNFLKAAGLASVAGVLAACTPAAQPQNQAAPTQPASGETKPEDKPAAAANTPISFWYYWGGGTWGETCDKVAKIFQEKNPTYEVQASTTGAEWSKVLSAFAAGSPPDVLLDFTGSQLMPRGQVLALDNYLAASSVVKPDNYYPNFLSAFTWDGVQYGLPAAEAGVDMALIINKGLAEEAGLDPKSPPQTIEEMLTWAEKMTKQGDNGILEQVGFDPLDGTSGQGFYNWSAVYGKNWWDVKTQKFDWLSLVDAFTWQSEWIKKWGAANFEAFRSGFGGWLEPDGSMALGKQGMHINGYWTPGELTLKGAKGQEWVYTWVPGPSSRKGVRFQTSLPTGIFLTAPGKNADAAFKLLEYICSDDANQLFFENAGGFAWTKSFLAKVDTSKYPGLDFYVKSISEADELYSNVQNCPLGFQFPQDTYTKAINDVIYNDAKPETALQEAQKACEDELTRVLRG